MVYYWMRLYVKFILLFFTKRLTVVGKELIPKTEPILFSCFHPNSFFDAIVLCCFTDRPIWSLSRGDAFKNKIAAKILNSFQMIPIHRLSEGKQHMDKNQDTYDLCQNKFLNNENVLIYTEGICKNQFELITPLKNGALRLAFKTWQANIPLNVMAVANNYTAYNSFGKVMSLHYGPIIKKEDLSLEDQEGSFAKLFNETLATNMRSIIKPEPKDTTLSSSWFYYLGWLINFPWYFLLIAIAKNKTKGTVFYDSVVFGLMVFTLPIYWLGLGLLLNYLI